MNKNSHFVTPSWWQMVGLTRITLGCTLGIHRCRGVLWDHWSMTGGRVCYARVGTAGTADGDHWAIDARASPLLPLASRWVGPSLSDRRVWGRGGRGLVEAVVQTICKNIMCAACHKNDRQRRSALPKVLSKPINQHRRLRATATVCDVTPASASTAAPASLDLASVAPSAISIGAD